MRRIALWVPDWPVNSLAAGLEAGEPGAVVASGRVEAATAAARSRGVRVGMRAGDASSRCPELVCLPRDVEREGRAFEAVLSAFDQVAAGVECLRPGLAWANAAGPARWAGGEEGAARGLVEAVEERVGVECFAGIADGPLGAVCAARQGRIVPAGGTARFLSGVPLGPVVTGLAPPGLRDREEAVALLRRLGIRVCADLLGMGATAVSSRFGAAGEFLWRAASGGELVLAGAPRPLGDIGTGVDIDEGGENVDAVLAPALRCAHDLADLLADHLGLPQDEVTIKPDPRDSSQLTASELRARRLRAHLSKADLAEMCGVNAYTVRNWEQGVRTVIPTRLLRVFQRLDSYREEAHATVHAEAVRLAGNEDALTRTDFTGYAVYAPNDHAYVTLWPDAAISADMWRDVIIECGRFRSVASDYEARLMGLDLITIEPPRKGKP